MDAELCWPRHFGLEAAALKSIETALRAAGTDRGVPGGHANGVKHQGHREARRCGC